MEEDHDLKRFGLCSFCPTEKLECELYRCPKCNKFYCSVRCYRNKRHLQCSEEFYKKQCEIEETSKSDDSQDVKRPITTFEQYMEREQNNKNELDENEINPEIPLNISADEQILFDSDDEPEYLGNIVESTMKEFETLDEKELERKLLGAGLPIGAVDSDEAKHEHLELLYQQLNDEEKKTFTAMAEGLFQDEFKSFTNCFRSKKNKD